jgi:hypothetical protein
MATSYLSCHGAISNALFDSSAKKCSTGWQSYTPPVSSSSTMTVSGELLTASDTLQLFGAVLFLVALWKSILIILNVMGIRV